MKKTTLSTEIGKSSSSRQKALAINLDHSLYGSFDEIGAGQEVVGHFFSAGGASGTVASSKSAYDMEISDAIYGECERYVCRERLIQMLDKEFKTLTLSLKKKAADKRFFSFADTVESLNYFKTNQGHGWMGIRFQTIPNGDYNEIILHFKLNDNNIISQQKAVGNLGVNLVYNALYHYENPDLILFSLLENLMRERVEIDMIRFSGPDFKDVDNRIMALKLVKLGMTDATLFDNNGEIHQPSEILYKKNILVIRGRFRPVTLLNMDMLNNALEMFKNEPGVDISKTEILFEINLKDLPDTQSILEDEFLSRVQILEALGYKVLISNYKRYYKLAEYLSQFNKKCKTAFILGYNNLEEIFEDDYYDLLPGGILQGFGIGFSGNLKAYIYPFLDDNNNVIEFDNYKPKKEYLGLLKYLFDTNKVQGIPCSDNKLLSIYSDDVYRMIKNNESGWEKFVPEKVAETIKQNELFSSRFSVILN